MIKRPWLTAHSDGLRKRSGSYFIRVPVFILVAMLSYVLKIVSFFVKCPHCKIVLSCVGMVTVQLPVN